MNQVKPVESHAAQVEVSVAPWERNQGRRLIKRLGALGFKGSERHAIQKFMSDAIYKLESYKAITMGFNSDQAAAYAVSCMGSIKHCQNTGNLGVDLVDFMISNGATPGSIKSSFEKMISVWRASNKKGVDPASLASWYDSKKPAAFQLLAIDEAAE